MAASENPALERPPTCPCCGARVRVHSSDEGTSSYVALGDEFVRWVLSLEPRPRRDQVTLQQIIDRAREVVHVSE